MGDVNEYGRGWFDGFNAGSQTAAPYGFEHPEPTDYDLGHRHGYAVGQKFADDLEAKINPDDLRNVVQLANEMEDRTPAEQASLDRLTAGLEPPDLNLHVHPFDFQRGDDQLER
jgi:hypothetical protein